MAVVKIEVSFVQGNDVDLSQIFDCINCGHTFRNKIYQSLWAHLKEQHPDAEKYELKCSGHDCVFDTWEALFDHLQNSYDCYDN